MVDYFEIGHIDNTHGLRGELKVRSYTEDKKRYEKLKSILILIKSEYKEFFIEQVRYQKDIILLKLKNVDSIEEAEKLKGLYIYIKREDARSLEEGEHFIADLIGLDVYYKNEKIGVLDDIFSAGSKDVYVIKRKGKNDLLLPGIDDCIKQIDYENSQIIVDIPKGLED